MKKILIDTSIWIEYFKGNEAIKKIMHDLDAGSTLITGPVMTELIQGMKSEKEKESFVMALKSIPRLEITEKE